MAGWCSEVMVAGVRSASRPSPGRRTSLRCKTKESLMRAVSSRLLGRERRRPGACAPVGTAPGCLARMPERSVDVNQIMRIPPPVAEDAVGPPTVGQRVLVENTRTIRQTPSRVPRPSVDLEAGEGFGPRVHAPAQGSTISIPISSKSRTLRVASLMRRAATMAAIWQSAEARGRPAERRAAAMGP